MIDRIVLQAEIKEQLLLKYNNQEFKRNAMAELSDYESNFDIISRDSVNSRITRVEHIRSMVSIKN